MKVKRSPNDIIEKVVDNMNSLPTAKHGIASNETEKNLYYRRPIENGLILDVWVMYQSLSTDTKDTKKINTRKKKRKLRIPLEIGDDVLLLSSRIKKKD